MATRTVRLDPEAEGLLQEIRRTTGLPISDVLKAGLAALRDQLRAQPPGAPFEVFTSLDLGPGGYAIAASSASKAGVRAALERKHRRD